MKKIVIILALWIVGLPAQAAVSPFEQLTSLFQQGTLPDTAKARGFWEGRCYSRTLQNYPQVFVLVFDKAPRPANYSLGLWTNDNVEYNSRYFANGIYIEDYEDIEKYTKTPEFAKASVSIANNSLVSHIGGSPALDNVMRQYKNYFVLKQVLAEDTIGANKGDTDMICYFFKKLTL